MKNFFYLLLLGCCLIALPLRSQNFSWQQLGGPFGGGSKVYAGKQGFLFMIFQDNVLYRSGDNGDSWQKMPPTPANIWYWPLVVAPDGNLYAGQNDKLYRSTDNGETWNQISTIYQDKITALPSGEILVSDSGEIKRSTDNGQNWTTVYSGLNTSGGFAYDPATDAVYTWRGSLGADNLAKVIRSTDHGQTWSVIFTQTGVQPSQMAFAPNGTIFIGSIDLIWRSTNNGTSWTSINPALSNSLADVQIAALATGRLLAFSNFRSKYSDDNGDTWQVFADNVGNPFSDFTVLSDGTLFALRNSHDGSLHRSTDNGTTWTFSANGILHSFVTTLQHIDETHMLALTWDGLFYSKDSGDSWKLVWSEITAGNSFVIGEGHGLSIGPDGAWYLWNDFNLIKFTNEGQQHTLLNVPIPHLYDYNGLWANPYQNGVVYLSTWDGHYRSVDGGENWVFVNSFDMNGLAFLSDGSLLANNPSMHKSVDGGNTWIPFSDYLLYSISPTGGLYAVDNTASILYYSPDNGFTWDSITRDLPTQWPGKMIINSSGYMYVFNNLNSTVYRSVDHGLTFNPLPQASEENIVYYDQISLNSSQYLFQKTRNNGIYRTTNPTTQVKLLTGSIFRDINDDCALANPDTLYPGRLLKATKNSEVVYGYTNPAGHYILPVNTGNYQLKIETPNDYWASCNGAVNIPSNNAIGIIDSADVGLKVVTECPYAEVNITAPFLRRCFPGQVYVHYRNTGTIPAQDAYLEITIDSSLIFNSASLPVAVQNGATYKFLLGNLAVDQKGVLILHCTPSCDAPLGYTHCLKAHIFPDELCPALNTPHLRTSATCLGDSLQLRIENVGTANMSAPQSWYALDPNDFQPPYNMLANGEIQLPAGGSFVTSLPAIYPTIDFVARQDPQYPFNTNSTTIIRGCAPDSNDPLSIVNEDEEGPSTDVFCQQNIGAHDPNEKIGFPAGLTDQGFIEQEQSLQYLIRFQNTGTDTAFNITVRDTLSVLLDPASVEILASSSPCQLRLTPSGVLLYSFENILLPDSNINEPASHGFVQFRIRQQPDNPFGSAIHNRAAIYFDYNAPVLTNTTLHTVGIPVVTAIKQPIMPLATVQCSPNPFHTTTILTLKNAPSIPGGFLLELFDTAGKQQRQWKFNGEQFTLQRGDLPNGMYNYVVKMADGKIVGSGSVVVQ